MTNIKRLGLGCMGMRLSNKEKSIETIHYALEHGITLFNTGDFYGNGESELVLGEALKGISREKYFVSVKFGMMPKPGEGMYGIDVDPWHVRSYLAYSLTRLGLDYIDLYQPARIDESVNIEDLMTSLKELVDEGYIKHIGLSMVDANTLRRACKIHPVHMIEVEYSLLNRDIENELIETAKELGVQVLAFGVLGHGIVSERFLENASTGSISLRMLSQSILNERIKNIKDLKEFALEKQTTLEQVATAWTWSKYDHVSTLIGTTSKEHLQTSIDALSLELNKDEISKIENMIPSMSSMRNLRFIDGKMFRV